MLWLSKADLTGFTLSKPTWLIQHGFFLSLLLGHSHLCTMNSRPSGSIHVVTRHQGFGSHVGCLLYIHYIPIKLCFCSPGIVVVSSQSFNCHIHHNCIPNLFFKARLFYNANRMKRKPEVNFIHVY